MRPLIDAAVIAELRSRVIAHNEAHPHAKAKLGDLRKQYERGFRRSNPGARALDRVDGYLQALAKAGGFDETEHPRDGHGEFSGGRGSAPSSAEQALPASQAAHRAAQAGSAGYRAVTTDVIPEQRYEAAGSLLRDGTSLAAGATVVASLAGKDHGKAAARVAGAVTGSVGRIVAGSAGAVVGQAAYRGAQALRRTTGIGPDITAKNAQSVRQQAAKLGQKAGTTVGSAGAKAASMVVRGALGTARDGVIHPQAVRQFRADVGRRTKAGMPLKQAFAASRPAAVLKTRRLGTYRRAGAFGVLAGAAGLGIRAQWKDSILDPAAAGHLLDAFSFREVQKAVGASDELGGMRAQMTEALAKGGAAGGSMADLGHWLENGGGEDVALRKAAPWGVGITRLFTAGASLAGGAAGGGAGFGISRATHPKGAPGAGFQEADHPRADDGKFTSKSGRDRRFAQVGALLGGAAAGIAVFAALKRHNGKMLSRRVAELERRTHALLQGAVARKFGASKRAVDTTIKRVTELIDNSPLFRADRAQLARIKKLGASDPTVMGMRLRAVFHNRIAEILSAHPDTLLPHGKEWRTLGEAMAEEPNPQKQIAFAKAQVLGALGPMTDADVLRAVSKLPKPIQKVVMGHVKTSRIQVGGVEAAMREHGQKIEASVEKVRQLELEAQSAETAHQLVTAEMKGAVEGAPLDAAKVLHAASAAKLAAADAALKKEQKLTGRLIDNPTGVSDPFTGKPVPPPTTNEVEARAERVRYDATQRATRIISAENDAAEAGHLRRIKESHNNVLAATAMRGAINGAPRGAKAATKALAALGEAEQAAHAKLVTAQVAHGLNRPDFDALPAATKYGKGGVLIDPPLRVMSAERRKFLRDNAAKIRTDHATTAKKLSEAEDVYGTARTKRDAANAVFQRAIDAAGVPKKARRIISGDLRRDLVRAREGLAQLAQPVRDFLNNPTGQELRSLARAIEPTVAAVGRRAYRGVKIGVKRTYEDLLTREGPNGREFSPGKAVRNAALVGSIATAAKVDLATAKDKYLGGAEAKQAARDRGFQIHKEERTDPLTGGGYFGLSVPHPEIKGERTLIWGEHFASDTAPARPMHAGGTMTETRQRMVQAEQERNQRNQVRTANGLVANAGVGPMSNLPDNARQALMSVVTKLAGSNGLAQYQTVQGGPVAFMRSDAHKSDDQSFETAASVAMRSVRDNHGLQQSPPTSAAGWHAAMADLFSTEGRSMRGKQMYREMTGFDEDGNAGKTRIFQANQGFRGDANAAGQAMLLEMDRLIAAGKPTSDQAANMMRAVAVVAHVKKVPAATLAELYKRIMAAAPQPTPQSPLGGNPFGPGPGVPGPGGDRRGSAAPQPAAVPAPGLSVVPGPGTLADGPAFPLNSRRSMQPPRPFDHQQGLRLGEQVAGKAADLYGVHMEEEIVSLGTAMHGFARELHASSSKMTEVEAFKAVNNAMTAMHRLHPEAEVGQFMFGTGPEGERNAENAAFMGLLHREGKKVDDTLMNHLGKLADRGVMERLRKVSMEGFVESLHPRAAAGEAAGGEFVAGSGDGSGGHGGHSSSTGGRMVGEGIEAGGKYAGRAAATAGREQGWAHPVRLGTELGGSLGAEVALRGAQTVARFLPGAAGKVAALGLEGVGAMVGGDYGSEAGGRVGSAAYTAATGHKAPGYNPPPPQDLGQGLAATGGAMGGGLWGNAAGMTAGAYLGRAAGGSVGALIGGPVGAVALGAAAGWAGEKAASGIYGYFAGFDRPAVDKAMARFAPKTRA